jgi:APA family basic amino acid/polyamine antiporter
MINVISGGMLDNTFTTLHVFGREIPVGWMQVTAISAIWIATLINCIDISSSSKVLSVVTGTKGLMLLFLGAASFFWSHGDWSHFSMVNSGGACEGVSASSMGGLAGIGAAMLGALWAYDGWSMLSIVAGEIKNPQKNIRLFSIF